MSLNDTQWDFTAFNNNDDGNNNLDHHALLERTLNNVCRLFYALPVLGMGVLGISICVLVKCVLSVVKDYWNA